MADLKKVATDLKAESKKIYSLYGKGKFSEAKNLLDKQLEKLDAIVAMSDGEIEATFLRLIRDRVVLLKVIELAISTEKTNSKVIERISKLEKNIKNVNQNVRKLNERIDDWESLR